MIWSFFRPKSSPRRLRFEGLTFSSDPDNVGWRFVFDDTEFVSFDPDLDVPPGADLAEIVTSVRKLIPQMRARIQTELAGYGGGMGFDCGESYTIDVQDFVAERTFIVSWSGGDSWADLGFDFTVKDGEIVAEESGD